MRPYEVICPDTTQLERAEWLKLRREGIGSSDAAATMEMSPWTSSYALWCDKRGLLPETEDTDRFWWGRALEPIILGRWSEQTGRKITARSIMLRSIEHPFMLCNPDGMVADGVVEVKTASSWAEAAWDGTLPDNYALQGAHACAVTGMRRCYFPVLSDLGRGVVEYSVDYDEATIAALISAETEFWRRVTENDPPDPDGSESARQAILAQMERVEKGAVVELPDEAEKWIDGWQHYKGLADSAERMSESFKQRLMLELREAEVGMLDGAVRVTYRADKNGRRTMRVHGKKEVAA